MVKFEMAPGYHGLCDECGQDVWEPNSTTRWVEFENREVTENDRWLEEEFGIPPITGVNVTVHVTCPK